VGILSSVIECVPSLCYVWDVWVENLISITSSPNNVVVVVVVVVVVI
jgi:hypothetical protein